jgi:hypothetical protein
MQSVNTTTPALEIDFVRSTYVLRLMLAAALLVGICVLTVNLASSAHWFGAALCVAMLVLAFAFLLSHVRVLFFHNPAIRIDETGIFDKRLTRAPIAWTKVQSIYPLHYFGWTKPYCIKIDVGVPRKSEIKLAYWAYFLTPRWHGLAGWDVPLIELDGLQSNPPQLSRDLIVTQIIEAARRFRPQIVKPFGHS